VLLYLFLLFKFQNKALYKVGKHIEEHSNTTFIRKVKSGKKKKRRICSQARPTLEYNIQKHLPFKRPFPNITLKKT
jgi:hypothetical protein